MNDDIKNEGTSTSDSLLTLPMENKFNNSEGLEIIKTNNNDNKEQVPEQKQVKNNNSENSSEAIPRESLTNDFVMIMEDRKDDDFKPELPIIRTKSMKSEIEKANLYLPYTVCII